LRLYAIDCKIQPKALIAQQKGVYFMSSVTVQARVSVELKKQADALFAALGLSTADAIRVFLQQSVNVGGLPFQLTIKRPNAETLEAMAELEQGGGKVFETTDELFADWKS
jgi:DNA-damage-inducible protein J